MRNSTTGAIALLFVLSLLSANNVRATLTERLDDKYLKSRIKLRMDEDWKVQTGNIIRGGGNGIR
jgi:hypothetical protein